MLKFSGSVYVRLKAAAQVAIIPSVLDTLKQVIILLKIYIILLHKLPCCLNK